MDNKSDNQLLIIKATIDANGQDSDEKMKKPTKDLTAMIASIMYDIKFSKYSTYKKDFPKDHYPTPLILDNKKDTQLEGGHSIKIGGMWNLKNEISSPKFYEILINIELKGNTDMDLKNFYNYINMCINAVTRLR